MVSFAIVGAAIFFVPPFYDAFGAPKLAVALFAAAAIMLRRGSALSVRSSLGAPVATFLIAATISALASVDTRVSLMGLYSQPFHGLAMIAAAIVVFAECAGQWIELPDIAVGLAAILGAVAFWQWRGLVPPPFDEIAGRAIGTLGSPVFFGAFLAPLVPLSLDARRWRWVGVLCALFAILMTRSRGALLSAGIGAIVARTPSGLFAFMPIFKPESDAFRWETWRIAWRAGLAHPVLGWGPDTFPLALRAVRGPEWHALSHANLISQPSAHNDVLQVWATMGAVGLAAYLWLHWRVWRLARRSRNKPLLGALLAIFIQAKLNPVSAPTILLLAALVGQLVYETDAPIGWRLPTAWAAVIVSMSLGSLAYSLPAEYHLMQFSRHKASDIKRASQELHDANDWKPDEFLYAERRASWIYVLLPHVGPRERREFSKRMLHAAGGVLRAHRQDSRAFELMAAVDAWAAPALGVHLLRDGSLMARRAQELDPETGYVTHGWVTAQQMGRTLRQLEDRNDEQVSQAGRRTISGPAR